MSWSPKLWSPLLVEVKFQLLFTTRKVKAVGVDVDTPPLDEVVRHEVPALPMVVMQPTRDQYAGENGWYRGLLFFDFYGVVFQREMQFEALVGFKIMVGKIADQLYSIY